MVQRSVRLSPFASSPGALLFPAVSKEAWLSLGQTGKISPRKSRLRVGVSALEFDGAADGKAAIKAKAKRRSFDRRYKKQHSHTRSLDTPLERHPLNGAFAGQYTAHLARKECHSLLRKYRTVKFLQPPSKGTISPALIL